MVHCQVVEFRSVGKSRMWCGATLRYCGVGFPGPWRVLQSRVRTWLQLMCCASVLELHQEKVIFLVDRWIGMQPYILGIVTCSLLRWQQISPDATKPPPEAINRIIGLSHPYNGHHRVHSSLSWLQRYTVQGPGQAHISWPWPGVSLALVFDMGNPWVNFRLSVPVSINTRTQASQIWISTGLGLGMGTDM